MFKVQKKQCETCIYRKDSVLDLKRLEAEIADGHGGFTGWRICHHTNDVCCAGFWRKHKNDFTMGQLAQRCDFVQFVQEDNLD